MASRDSPFFYLASRKMNNSFIIKENDVKRKINIYFSSDSFIAEQKLEIDFFLKFLFTMVNSFVKF